MRAILFHSADCDGVGLSPGPPLKPRPLFITILRTLGSWLLLLFCAVFYKNFVGDTPGQHRQGSRPNLTPLYPTESPFECRARQAPDSNFAFLQN